MFVSESNIFNPASIRIRISSLEGVNTQIEVTPDTLVDQLKIEAVSQIYDMREGQKLSLYYRLLHVSSGQVLTEESTVLLTGIKDNDELILLKNRTKPSTVALPSVQKDQSDKVPSAEDIETATRDVPKRHSESQFIKPTNAIEFQKELRKILVSLIDVAQKLLCLNKESVKDAHKYVTDDRRRPQAREKSPSVDKKALQVLVNMGFDKERAATALRITKMSEAAAVQWLIDNPSEDSATAEPSHPVAVETPTDEEDVAGGSAEERDENLRKLIFELAKASGPDKVKQMLKAFQRNRRQEFKPDAAALQNLLEMGFEEDDIIDALRNHGNRQQEACDWLLSRGEGSPPEPEVEEGLEPDSAVYKAIFSSHVIQLALSNPKTLIALLQILENPNTMQQWFQDAELSPLLLQISRIYHSEKYSQ